MDTMDECCTLAPYFKIHEGQLDAFKKICTAFVEKTSTEPKCQFYGYTFSGNEAHCREGYEDAEAVLFHLKNVGALLKDVLEISEITHFEIHGPESQLALLREHFAALNPKFFSSEVGFRR